MVLDTATIHLIAGGIAGTTGAVLTCPLEVVKTRLQSSVATFQPNVVVTPVSYFVPQHVATHNYTTSVTSTTCPSSVASTATCLSHSNKSVGLWHCLRHIVQHEGLKGLFKGLGPNLVGVAPSRAIYFCSYSTAKLHLNELIPPDTPLVHILSAACAGFMASTCTNPIWFIKTRVQLDQKRSGNLTAWSCIKSVYHKNGLTGFYRGITASYYGIAETVVHFVIYEYIKSELRSRKGSNFDDMDRGTIDFVEFMCAGACSKTIATCLAYPHEVARTRLRQEGSRYRYFWQTLMLVGREEGARGLYRGLCTQLVRQIPNTAIMMSTYEGVVYLCTKYLT